MEYIENLVNNYAVMAWLLLALSFIALAKFADIFVESAVSLANKLGIPKLVIGIVLVSFATTAPELSVSLLAALKGNPEMALGNAIGSVICNEGMALGLAGLFSVSVIHVIPKVLKTSGFFLILVQIVAFIFVCRDFQLSRFEGLTLVILFCIYLGYMYWEHKTGRLQEELETEAPEEYKKMSMGKMTLLFAIGLGGIILSSKFVVMSATAIAIQLNIPEAVIALTLVAFGTSVPEIATCVVSAKKGHGDIAVGNIIGANILNICWVAGASAIANNLTLDAKQIYFMFPVMFVMVLTRIVLLFKGYTLTKGKAIILLILYVIYLILSIIIFPPKSENNKELENKVAAEETISAIPAASGK